MSHMCKHRKVSVFKNILIINRKFYVTEDYTATHEIISELYRVSRLTVVIYNHTFTSESKIK